MTASHQLLGTWKLISFQVAIEDSGERHDVYDAHPLGFLIVTERRFTAFLTAGDQPRDADRATLFDRLMAYSGVYRVEADKIIVTVDIAWHPSWLGTEQTRFFQLDGDRLSIISAPYSIRNSPISSFAALFLGRETSFRGVTSTRTR